MAQSTRTGSLSDIPEAAICGTRRSRSSRKNWNGTWSSRARGPFVGDPLSVASLIGYFWAKYNEITNIRVISRCKTADFPVENLKEELVYV